MTRIAIQIAHLGASLLHDAFDPALVLELPHSPQVRVGGFGIPHQLVQRARAVGVYESVEVETDLVSARSVGAAIVDEARKRDVEVIELELAMADLTTQPITIARWFMRSSTCSEVFLSARFRAEKFSSPNRSSSHSRDTSSTTEESGAGGANSRY